MTTAAKCDTIYPGLFGLLSGGTVWRFVCFWIPRSKIRRCIYSKLSIYDILQPQLRCPSVTSSMIGGVNQAKCAPPILPTLIC
jgi:hypothetical protein